MVMEIAPLMVSHTAPAKYRHTMMIANTVDALAAKAVLTDLFVC